MRDVRRLAAHAGALAHEVDGRTQRQHLEAVAHRDGRAAARLAGPGDVSAGARGLFALYERIKLGRGGGGGMGVSVLGWEAVAAFVAVTGERLLPGEAEAVLAADHAFLSALHSGSPDLPEDKG